MNWKTLLVIASLSLSAGLTACNKEAAPDATKTDTTAPAETKPAGEMKAPEGAMKAPEGAKTDAPKGDMKPADGAKTDAPKGDAKPADAKKDATKKP
jgi:uncharacterized lipoprotein